MNIKQYISEIVQFNSEYDKYTDHFSLRAKDLPEIELSKASSIILASDDALASEATGPDNGLFANKMLPALLNHLSDITDTDKAIEFKQAWQDGINNYLMSTIQDLIDDELSMLNSDDAIKNGYVRPSYALEANACHL